MKKIYLCLLLILFCFNITIGQTYNWTNVAMGGGGFVSGIVTNKKAGGPIYARTDVGGAYRWDAANKQWIPLTDFASDSQQGIYGVEAIAIDPASPNVVYISAGISYFNSGKSYILRSADYGATFSVTDITAQFKVNGNGSGRQDGERLQVDPANSNVLFCGTRANGLFQSTDAGVTWNRLNGLNITTTPNANGVNFVVLDNTTTTVINGVKQSKTIFAGASRAGGSNFYRSDDGGVTFNPVVNSNLLDATQMPHRAVLSGNGYLYITYSNGAGPGATTDEPCNTGQIWRYTIADGNWLNVTPVISGSAVNKPYCGISIDPANPSRIIASTVNNYSLQYNNGSTGVYGDRIYYSTNGGTTWTDIVARGFSLNANGISWITGQSIHWAGSIEFDPANTNSVFLNSGNGVFINNDITATAGIWNFAAKGIEEVVAQNIITIPGGNIVSVISDYDGFTQTDPAVFAANRHTPTMGSTTGLDYAVNSKKVVRVASAMYYSNDQGITWIKTTGVLGGTGGQVALSADGNVILHGPSGSAVTYRSTDNGGTWTAVNGLSVSGARPVADGVNSSKFYAYNNGPLMVSINGGVSFTAAANAGSGGSKVIRTVPGREGHVWTALLSGGLTHTEDSGISFIKSTNVSYCGAVGLGKALTPGSYETLFIYGTVNDVLGIHRSTDKGLTWVRINDDSHQYGGPANGQFVQGDLNVYGRVYMSTAGRGIVCGTAIPPKTPTDVSLSSSVIYQNNTVGELVGNLATAADDQSTPFTYALVSGAGSDDNAAFLVSGNQLKAAIVFNSAVKSTYNIRLKTTNSDGNSFEKMFTVTVKSLFVLPATNFKVAATNETCSNNNDGKINITATQTYNYTATVITNGVTTTYPFTTALEVSPLIAGNYNVCITVAGQADYKQCFDLVITEPTPLSVYATINQQEKNVVLDLGGSLSYFLSLNGHTQVVSSGQVKLKLAKGRNDLLVSTDKDCQGLFTKTIFLEDGKQVYPVPFNNTLFVNMGTDLAKSAQVNLYSAFGAIAFSKLVTVNNNVIELSVSDLKPGIYIVKVKTDSGESSTKIFKK
jgi:xyloglucan-specific exo-beta-1,4-glucanase